MSEHFIKNIEIKEYKLFNDFKAEGFGRVNLIGGKNNVGKTAFMEACYVSLQNNKESFIQILTLRNKRNYIFDENYKFQDFIELSLNKLIKKTFKITINKKQTITDTILKDAIHFIYQRQFNKLFDSMNKNIQFLDGSIDDRHLEHLYSIWQESNKEDKFDFYLKQLDNSIQKFKFIKSEPKIQLENNENYINLSDFGDGLKIYITIICAIFYCKNGQLFIDEIGNGIHYTNLDKLWEIILTISKEQNVQVFATTHSKECIESYARVAKKLEDKEIAFIEMGINKYNKPRAIVMDSDRFYDELEIGNEVRGW